MNREANSSKGFTLIELMMAMSFVSVLLLVIAMTVIQICNIYNKGLTMKAVDQAGRSLSVDIRHTLSASQPFSVSTAFISQHAVGDPTSIGGGRLCTGVYSYVWNLGKFIDNPVNKYSDSTDTIRFIRVQDSSGSLCTDQSLATAALGFTKRYATELLSTEGANLAIQNFNITTLANSATIGQALYRVVMEIGTNDSGTLQQSIDSVDTNCKPPSDVSSLQDFCAVNQFDFTAQAGNKGE